ncbi:conserved hypothetical protein [Talaromyces stipitatus ATCC 10500]|uniref:Uncharacterized protein n=1 Tax=Talaromyces stipitatus (strain ATCC 10500 / CBS 375.48 / QM 6759 / NRRL 1006) TaxID=441959 RepID=B8M5L1_TALSN|nr:uncharacterized protein TSTA_031650 [Talaromyces stipitatus ATCC 10500]EED19905.1 conserved hypothetical protein [Talaromyces stipitatus ATCC 10500]
MAKATKRSVKGKEPSKSTAKPPTPFVKAPSILKPFLELLSLNEIYLIHIDRESPDFKKQLFILPVLLNTAIVLFFAYRIYNGFYVYPDIFASALGLSTKSTVDLTSQPMKSAVSTVLRRTLTFSIDYFLVTIFLLWPIRFIQGPIYWRRKVGFRQREVVVRQSRSTWSATLERNRWVYGDEKVVREKVVPAVAPQRIKKSGYLLIDADWDLDYKAMVRAHELIDNINKGSGVQLDEFRTAILVNTDDEGWLIWRVADENNKEREQQRDQLFAFQEKLTSMGKEDLFFRWVELVQYESSQPGGFTPERQRNAMLQAQEMFESEGVDFSQFWREVGGMQGIDLS